jgi:GT2 family glycosyltransferase
VVTVPAMATNETHPIDNKTPASPGEVGVVVIGRNEGDRLLRCLDSLQVAGIAPQRIVYVDSGSTDGSVERVKARGIETLVLEPPFTAAKGRNAGIRHLLQRHEGLFALQFVDGDCEYFPAWVDVASRALGEDPTIAAVTGVQHERRPDATVYNLLCEVEWTGVLGEIDSFAGNVMVRVSALRDTEAATGTFYDPDLIAGEDPEFSIRIRKTTGLRVVRIDEPICLHDVDMTALSQWWKRNVRAGHAYAQVSRLHGDAPLHFWKRETRSNWLWGAVLPLAAPPLVGPAYMSLFWRVYRDARARGLDAKAARVYAFFTTVGKVPQALGQAKYWWNELRGKKSGIIEYKSSSSSPSEPSK